MLVKEVLLKYHKIVPFPWSISKIKKAGYQPTELLLEVGTQLNQCTDANSDAAKQLIETLQELKMFL